MEINLQVESLHSRYDKLQLKYGDKSLRAIYGAGCITSPKACLVFMNPTGRNVSATPVWTGLRAPWLGTKVTWRFLSKIGCIGEGLLQAILAQKPREWSPEFCQEVYAEVARNGFFITNLAKCTQLDAREIPDTHYEAYKKLLEEELSIVAPKRIILFGNQVSSVIKGGPVKVSEYQKKSFNWKIGGKVYKAWPTYYPVGNGFMNAPKAIENIRHVLDKA